MNLIIRKLESAPGWPQRVEVVERKGIGHPEIARLRELRDYLLAESLVLY